MLRVFATALAVGLVAFAVVFAGQNATAAERAITTNLAAAALLSPPSTFPVLLLDLFHFPAVLGRATTALWTAEMLACVMLQNAFLALVPGV